MGFFFFNNTLIIEGVGVYLVQNFMPDFSSKYFEFEGILIVVNSDCVLKISVTFQCDNCILYSYCNLAQNNGE